MKTYENIKLSSYKIPEEVFNEFVNRHSDAFGQIIDDNYRKCKRVMCLELVKVTHCVRNMKLIDEYMYGDVEILDTPNGLWLQKVLEYTNNVFAGIHSETENGIITNILFIALFFGTDSEIDTYYNSQRLEHGNELPDTIDSVYMLNRMTGKFYRYSTKDITDDSICSEVGYSKKDGFKRYRSIDRNDKNHLVEVTLNDHNHIKYPQNDIVNFDNWNIFVNEYGESYTIYNNNVPNFSDGEQNLLLAKCNIENNSLNYNTNGDIDFMIIKQKDLLTFLCAGYSYMLFIKFKGNKK